MKDQLTFRIPRELSRALQRRAKARGVPRSQVVREALSAYLAQTAPASKEELQRRLQRFMGVVSLPPIEEADDLTRQIYEHNFRR